MKEHHIFNVSGRVIAILLTFHFSLLTVSAQTVKDLIIQKPAYATCNYDTYPDSIPNNLTPAPKGKKPFYISHYGRHGSRYISSRAGFDIPFRMIAHADSVDELTPTGERVLQEMKLVMADTEGRWGELTRYGVEQHRNIARRMIERFPEVFSGDARVSCVSTVVPRCIESMGAAMIQMKQMNPQLRITMEASQRNQWYMNHQNPQLRRNYMTPEARKAYDKYISTRLGNSPIL